MNTSEVDTLADDVMDMSHPPTIPPWRLVAVTLGVMLSVGCTNCTGPQVAEEEGGTDDAAAELCRRQNISPTEQEDAHLGCDELDEGTAWANNLTIYRVDEEATRELGDKFREDDESPVDIRPLRMQQLVTHPDLATLREAVESAVDDQYRVVYRYLFENTAASEKQGADPDDPGPIDIEAGQGVWSAMVVRRESTVPLDEVESVELVGGHKGRRARIAVDLSDANGESFHQFTRQHTKNTMAFVYDDTFVVSAPEIYEPISGGRLQLPPPFGPAYALRRLPEALD